MTQNQKDIRRKALRKEESLFRLQAPYLRRLGGTKAALTADDDTADALRDLDLLVWDETECYLSCFASDPTDAPDMVTDLLPRTARRGRQLGIEVELPPLVAALTCIRIWAGGDDVYAKHRPLFFAIMNSQDSDPRYRPLFERFCQEIETNKYDPPQPRGGGLPPRRPDGAAQRHRRGKHERQGRGLAPPDTGGHKGMEPKGSLRRLLGAVDGTLAALAGARGNSGENLPKMSQKRSKHDSHQHQADM